MQCLKHWVGEIWWKMIISKSFIQLWKFSLVHIVWASLMHLMPFPLAAMQAKLVHLIRGPSNVGHDRRMPYLSCRVAWCSSEEFPIITWCPLCPRSSPNRKGPQQPNHLTNMDKLIDLMWWVIFSFINSFHVNVAEHCSILRSNLMSVIL